MTYLSKLLRRYIYTFLDIPILTVEPLLYIIISWYENGNIMRSGRCLCRPKVALYFFVAPGFKNKTRYTLYVSQGSQISHIATNKSNIKRQCLNT